MVRKTLKVKTSKKSSEMLLASSLILSFIVLLIIRAAKRHEYWKEKNIRYVKPWPLFGSLLPTILKYKSFPDLICSLCKVFPEQRYFGFFYFLKPFLMVKDPELTRKIVADLYPFEEIALGYLINASTIIPVKESARKRVFEELQALTKQFVLVLSNRRNLELNQFCTQLASAAASKVLYERDVRDVLEKKRLARRNCLWDFLKSLVFRIDEHDGVTRYDFGHQIEEMRNIEVSHEVMEFVEAAVIGCVCLMYELAENPDIQSKVTREIEREGEGEITFPIIQRMEYLHRVVLESLRKWPVIPQVILKTNKGITVDPVKSWEKPLQIDAKTILIVPTLTIHMNGKLFLNPEKFDPTRFPFELENRLFCYLPFGVNNDVASLVIVLQMKLLLCNLLTRYEIVKIGKTVKPVPDKRKFTLLPKNEIWVGLKSKLG